ncbi:MAG: TVP38/TMEM64 family protein [Hyphomonadaceae bacterium]|nr:TVP38/TMEM64 family protein [Hyphomonadaceae bacterium]
MAALLGLLGLVLFSDIRELVSVQVLRAHHAALADWTARNPLLAAGAFTGSVAGAMAIGFPIVFVMSFAGGLLFGLWTGAALSLVGATAGGLVFFLAARHAREAALASPTLGGALRWIEEGFRGDELLSLMALRLAPVFPTAAVTLAAAAARMKVRDFVLASLIGAAPATMIYAALGAGAGALLEREVSLRTALLRPEYLAPLLGLAALMLAAVWLRRRARRR